MSSPFYDSSCDSDVGSDGTDPVVPRRSLSLSPSAKTRKRAIESSGLGGYSSPITRASVPSGFSSAMPVDFGISNAMSSGAKCTQDPHLRFSSCFESGNLKAAFYSEDQKAYNLVLEPDLNSRGHTLWFYFAVQNVQGGQTETFNIINLCKAHSLFENGMKPFVFSQIGASRRPFTTSAELWEPGGYDVSYTKNDLVKMNMEACDSDEDESGKKYVESGNYHTLSFTYTFPFDDDTVFFAAGIPYTYTDSMALVDWAANGAHAANKMHANCVRRRLLARSIAGLRCECLSISNWDVPRKFKRVICLSARVHPGESNSNWICHGVITFLVSNHAEAAILRDRFIWKVIPCLNPDGVVIGNYRCNLAGVDLNRQWLKPDPDLHPTIFLVKELLSLVRQQGDVSLYIDIHGHSRKLGAFTYSTPAQTEADSKAHLSKTNHQLIRLFPRVFSVVAQDFSYSDCRWRMGKSKRATGRVVAAVDLGVLCSYTLEASFFGPKPTEGKVVQQYTAGGYAKIGMGLCESVLVMFRLRKEKERIPLPHQLRGRAKDKESDTTNSKEKSYSDEKKKTVRTKSKSKDKNGTSKEKEKLRKNSKGSAGPEDFALQNVAGLSIDSILEGIDSIVDVEDDASSVGSDSAPSADNLSQEELKVHQERIRKQVEEKFPQENFRVVSEMRILGKNRVAILDFCRVCRFFNEIWREIRF